MSANTTLCCGLYSELSCKQLWLVHCDFVQEDSNLHFKGHGPVQVCMACAGHSGRLLL